MLGGNWSLLHVAALIGRGNVMGFDVHDIRNYGAAVNNSTNDRAAIQAAIDAAYAAGGGIVFFPIGSAAVGTPGLVLKNGVNLLGASKIGSLIRFSGTFTDSHIRPSTRDDNIPNNYDVVQIENLRIQTSSSAVPLLDMCGTRYFSLRNLMLQGQGYTRGDVAISLSDKSPDGTSHKTCFFGDISNVGNYGAAFGTFVKYNQSYGDCNQIFFLNMSGAARTWFDFSDDSVAFDANCTINSGYFVGDSHVDGAFFRGNVIPPCVFLQSISQEGFANVPPETLKFCFKGTSGQVAEVPGIKVRNTGIVDIQGGTPVIASDIADSYVVDTDFSMEVVQETTTSIRIKGGVAYNTYRLNVVGQSRVISVTNTGSAHTEYAIVNNQSSQSIAIRTGLTLTPAGTDLIIAEIAVSSTGTINSITIVAPVGAAPAFRQMTLTGLPTADPVSAGVLWNDAGTVKISGG